MKTVDELRLEHRTLLKAMRQFHDEVWMSYGVTLACTSGLLEGGCSHPFVKDMPLTGRNVRCDVCGYEVGH